MKRKKIAVEAGLSILDHPELLDISRQQEERVLPVLRDLLASQKSSVADLLLGRPGYLWTHKEMQSLEHSIIERVIDQKFARDCLRLLFKAVTAWVIRNKREVPFPHLYTLPKYAVNPLPVNLRRVFETYDAWKKFIAEQLAHYQSNLSLEDNRDDTAVPPTEIVIASAILYGGIYDIQTLIGIVRGFPTVVPSSAISARRIHVGVWVDRAGIHQFRVWHPDLLTATLLFRCAPESAADLLVPEDGSDGGSLPEHILTSRLRRQFNAWTKSACGTDRSKLHILGGLQNLLRVAQKIAYLELPVIIAAYASGVTKSHSLGFDVIRRVSRHEWAGSLQTALDETENPTARIIKPAQSSDGDNLNGELAPFCDALSSDDRKEIRKKLQQLQGDVSLSLFQRSMAEFALSILCLPVKNDRREPASVRETTLAVANAMHRVIGKADPLSMLAKDIDPLIKYAVENAKKCQSSSAFANTMRAFFLFNTFLVAHGIKDKDRSSFLIIRKQHGHVDANLLSFEEYRAILEEIRMRWPVAQSVSRQQLAVVLVILGFRCGLRREEARKIKIGDVLSGGISELLIRCSTDRTLKSNNANRRVLFNHFLEPDELTLIEQWLKSRIDQQHSPERFLFEDEEKDLLVVPSTIFDTINEIMRRVTGDPNIHFHHLRHSFATWGFLRLMYAVLRPIPELCFAPPETRAWLENGTTFRPDRLYRHKFPTRKHAYLLARFMGHGSPATSLGTYVHCLDWLLASALDQSERMSPDEVVIEAASGLNRNTYQRWVQASDCWEVPLTFWRQRAGTMEPNFITGKDPVIATPALLNLNELERTWNFLMAAHKPGMTTESAATAWGIDINFADKILERCLDLKKSSGLRNANQEQSLTAGKMGTKQLSLEDIPKFPRHEADKQALVALAAFMQSMQSVSSDKDVLATALATYMNRVWQRKGHVHFHDSTTDGKEARLYMEFVDTLPFPCAGAELISFDISERSRIRPAWRLALQIGKDRKIKTMHPSNIGCEAAKSWLAVRPKFQFNSSIRSQGPGNAGFRFAMTIGFLRYGHI